MAELIAENKCLERMELRGNFIGLPGLIALRCRRRALACACRQLCVDNLLLLPLRGCA